MEERIAARFTSALYMFTIANDSITEKGVLKAQHSNYKPQNPWWYYGANTIKRSVIADNFVYAISNSGVISADMNDLAKPLQVLTFASE
ncbi:MAG: beta-propeller domain-containing protein [Oligoflexales bacterium]